MVSPKTTPITSDMNTLLIALDDIASHPGLKVKESLLEHYLDYTCFRQLVDLLLNPYLRFGITSYIPYEGSDIPEVAGGMNFYEGIKFFDHLVKRDETGNDARRYAGRLVAAGFPGELMTRILTKDPKAGFGDTLVNKVMKGLLPEFPYMRCALPEKSNIDKFDWKEGIFSELKADGMFMNVDHDAAGQVQLMSRQGSIFPEKGFEQFHKAVRDSLKKDTQTHGEMVVYMHGQLLPRQAGNGMINSVIQGAPWPAGTRIQFLAWDQIPLFYVKPKGKYRVEYETRYDNLVHQLANWEATFPIKVIPCVMVKSKKEAYEHFREIVLSGGEGTVVKSRSLIWADGTSKDQVKLKLAFIVDLKMVGLTEGKGKFAKTFGAIKMESSDGLLKVNVSGMDDATRKYIAENWEKISGTIAAVEANAVFKPSPSNPNYSLSHPRFIEARSMADKSVADTLQQVFDQERAAMEAAAAI